MDIEDTRLMVAQARANTDTLNGNKHLEFLLARKKSFRPLPVDWQREKDLVTSKIAIVARIDIPPSIQMVRLELYRLKYLLYLYQRDPPQGIPKEDVLHENEIHLLSAPLKKMIVDWVVQETSKIERLQKLKELNVRLRFEFGASWKMLIYVQYS